MEIMDDLLPIGSVVISKAFDRKITIVGYLPFDSESNNFYDYFCASSKFGLNKDINKSKKGKDYFYINKEDVEDILFIGYMNDDYYLYKDCFNEIKKIGTKKITKEDIVNVINKLKGEESNE